MCPYLDFYLNLCKMETRLYKNGILLLNKRQTLKILLKTCAKDLKVSPDI